MNDEVDKDNSKIKRKIIIEKNSKEEELNKIKPIWPRSSDPNMRAFQMKNKIRELEKEVEEKKNLEKKFADVCKNLEEKNSYLNTLEKDRLRNLEVIVARNKSIEDLQISLDESERSRRQLQAEIDFINTKETADKKNLSIVSQQLQDARKNALEKSENVARLEENRKKMLKDLEEMQHRVDELQKNNEKLEKSKKKVSAELEDANIELDNHRLKVIDLEKKQSNFDKILAQEKLNSELISTQRDNAKRDAREKETKLLNLNRSIGDIQASLDESERSRRQLQVELATIINTQGTADKNVHELEKAKRQLEQELTEQKTQLEELEDELQQTEDQKMRLEVNMQALKTQFERDLAAKEEAGEEKRRGMAKQLRDLESELDEERKQKQTAVNAKKKLETNYKALESKNQNFLNKITTLRIKMKDHEVQNEERKKTELSKTIFLGSIDWYCDEDHLGGTSII